MHVLAKLLPLGVQGGACCFCFNHHLLGHEVTEKHGNRSLADEVDILRALTQIEANVAKIATASGRVECDAIWADSEQLVHFIADK